MTDARRYFLNDLDLATYEAETGTKVRDPVIGSGKKYDTTAQDGIIMPMKPPDEPPDFVWAKDVKIESVKWAWYPYFIDENTNIFGGEAGTGKTWNLCAVVAAITNDRQPEGMPGIVEKHGNVLYLGGEDGDGEMSRRLKLVGADLSKVALVEKSFNCMDKKLLELIDAVKPVMVIFDSLLSYFPRDMNHNSYTDIRKVMDYLRDLARDKSISIICVIHPPKKDDYRLIHRFTGSGGFVDSVRCVTYLGYHPTEKGKRVGIQPKNNAANTAPYVFQFDESMGLVWCGDDESVTLKDVEKAARFEEGKSGNLEYYVKVIEDVMKLHPEGLHMTAKDILKEYGKILEHGIDKISFGQALSNDVFQDALLRRDIVLKKGTRTNNRQKYRIYYKNYDPFTP